MNYEDHLTKCILFKILKSRRTEEIAFNLIDIYTTFGVPAIFHSDNGRKCLNIYISELNVILK